VTAIVRTGWIEDLTRRVSVQASPFLFVSPRSSYVKGYFIKQRYFGAGVELGLYYAFR
jgi:hypothetical protein